MSYANLISAQTGSTDPATVELIEELMRADRTALDDLTPAEFAAAVIDAVADAAELEAAGMLTGYCRALGIAVPAGVTAGT
jgi:hypothetical protein